MKRPRCGFSSCATTLGSCGRGGNVMVENRILISLSLFLMLLLSQCSAYGKIDILVGSVLDSQAYPGIIAADSIGSDDFETLYAANLNLILPPQSKPKLCDYPEEAYRPLTWTGEETENNIQSDNTNHTSDGSSPADYYDETQFIHREYMDVALFVQYGQCPVSLKARIAVDLKMNYTRYGTVTHLIIYNMDDSHLDEMNALTSYGEGDYLENIHVIFVSNRTGQDMLETIESEATRQRIASPIFLAEGNELWFLPVSFQKPSYGQYSGSGGDGYDDNIEPYGGNDNYGDPPYPPRQSSGMHADADDFYWFRLIVFSLLVVSPCFRAAYLWYAGGARIRFRYNEQGRIVGLQYIPPMPYWFAPRPDDSYGQQATRMTEEEVMALPEIIYGESSLASDPLLEQQSPGERQQQDQQQEPSSQNESDEKRGEQSQISPYLEAPDVDPNTSTEISTVNEEQAPEASPQDPYNYEMHSTCSICIEDFEAGERLRLLPRCRHIFHTECILPWLTERQGCCPLCKTEVIEPEHEDEDDDVNSSENGEPAGARHPVSVEGFSEHGTGENSGRPTPDNGPDMPSSTPDLEIVVRPSNAPSEVDYDRIEGGQR